MFDRVQFLWAVKKGQAIADYETKLAEAMAEAKEKMSEARTAFIKTGPAYWPNEVAIERLSQRLKPCLSHLKYEFVNAGNAAHAFDQPIDLRHAKIMPADRIATILEKASSEAMNRYGIHFIMKDGFGAPQIYQIRPVEEEGRRGFNFIRHDHDCAWSMPTPRECLLDKKNTIWSEEQIVQFIREKRFSVEPQKQRFQPEPQAR